MIQFIYIGDAYDSSRESVVENVFNIVKTLMDMPAKIEVEFRALSPSIYEETLLDRRFKNRIRLHEELTPKEVIVPLIHELVHLNQIHTGQLSGRRDGSFMWKGQVYRVPEMPSIEAWSNFPWEIDVIERQDKLLEDVLTAQNLTKNDPSAILDKWKQLLNISKGAT